MLSRTKLWHSHWNLKPLEFIYVPQANFDYLANMIITLHKYHKIRYITALKRNIGRGHEKILVIRCIVLSLMKVCEMIFWGSGNHFQDSCLALSLTCPKKKSEPLSL